MRQSAETRAEIDKLVKEYADSDRSDTFVSYNDAIVLAREVRRLRESLRRERRRHALYRMEKP